MKQNDLRDRTKRFALRIMNLVEALPNSIKGRTLAGQIMRSSTSVAANYRAACRGRSKPEFISKIGIVIEEADETALWLELIAEGNVLPMKQIRPLLDEAGEIVAIMNASRITAVKNRE